MLDVAGEDPVVLHAMSLHGSSTGSSAEGQGCRDTQRRRSSGQRFEQLAGKFDPETGRVLVTDDLRGVAVAAEAVGEDEARLREAVEVARAHGRSWNQIAVALGVSRQAARQRFADKLQT
ncbi:MAG TPA: hypothetical protein VHF25_14385 [Nitriliruptorales bacterium]|nr:hypothetical protein [Nitriliruptorales bacterium]